MGPFYTRTSVILSAMQKYILKKLPIVAFSLCSNMLLGRSLLAAKGGYLEGRGGRFQNNARMQGLSPASLR
jgi:hypothetical protein